MLCAIRIRIRIHLLASQEFDVAYSKAQEQRQSSNRLMCHSHNMKSTGREPTIVHIAACCTMHCATGED